MNKYITCLVITALSSLLSGFFWDLGYAGISVAFGIIATLLLAVVLQIYLDSGTKFIDVDNARKVK